MDRHGVYSQNDIRCYSACFIATGFAQGAINTSSDEVKFWAQSPLVREVTGQPPRAGDVIMVAEGMKAKIPVEHVATYVSPGLIFQKASPMSQDPFELITAKTFAREYSLTTHPNQHLFRQVETLSHYVERHRAQLPAELLDAIAEIGKIERETEPEFHTHRDDPHFLKGFDDEESQAWAEEFSARVKQIAQRATELESLARSRLQALGGAPGKDAERFLWEFAAKRAGTLQFYPDPFN
jgi:hypothetical protein